MRAGAFYFVRTPLSEPCAGSIVPRAALAFLRTAHFFAAGQCGLIFRLCSEKKKMESCSSQFFYFLFSSTEDIIHACILYMRSYLHTYHDFVLVCSHLLLPQAWYLPITRGWKERARRTFRVYLCIRLHTSMYLDFFIFWPPAGPLRGFSGSCWRGAAPQAAFQKSRSNPGKYY